MGHTRLGTIPKTRKWRDVLGMLEEAKSHYHPEALVAQVSAGTLRAAGEGFAQAPNDAGVVDAYFSLLRFAVSFESRGTQAPATALDAVRVFQAEVLSRSYESSDLSEMARKAASQALLRVLRPPQESLFDPDSPFAAPQFSRLRSRQGLGDLCQGFFGLFTAQFISFYISRLPTRIPLDPHLDRIGTLSRFRAGLEEHCYQSAAIVRDFSVDWTSKARFRNELGRDGVSKFLHVALSKMLSELTRQISAE